MPAPAKSATLAMNDFMQTAKREGRSILNLGFGEAGLPVLPSFHEIVADHTAANEYPLVQGSRAARTAISGYFTRRHIAADSEHCIVGPGSKALLYALLANIPGDIILARPSWVSYAAQARQLGKTIRWIDAPESACGIPDPAKLEVALNDAAAHGNLPSILLLTSPDNPSGTTANRAQISALTALADKFDLTIISDEIYRDLAYSQETYVSPAELAPDRTIVTAGLSKSLALGGWRLGVARLPLTEAGSALATRLIGFASEVWSGIPTFLQPVVEYAFSEPSDVITRVTESRKLHATVAAAFWDIFHDAGANVRRPTGGFYLYPTFAGTALAERWALSDDTALASKLLHEFSIATLPGQAFGDDPARMGLRVVTSMVYGTTDAERLTTLHAQQPLSRPSVAHALEQLHNALHS